LNLDKKSAVKIASGASSTPIFKSFVLGRGLVIPSLDLAL